MNFKDKSLTINGEKRPMQMLSSGHPALDTSDYDENGEFDQEYLVGEAEADHTQEELSNVESRNV